MAGGPGAAGAAPPAHRPPRAAPQVSLSAFAFLFSEMVQYSQTRVANVGELERR